MLAIASKVKKAVGVAKILKMDRCGNVRCFLHDSRGVPRVTIGPSWPFAIVLLVYATFLTVVHFKAFKALILLHAGYYIVGVGTLLYSLGIWGLLHTFFGDPGIPEEIFLRYSDPSFSLETDPDEEEEPAVEITRPTSDWCSKCLVPTDEKQVHCHVCNVCIKDYDHHCVFFGKCIGGGNVRSFRLVVAMAVISTIYAGAMYGWYAMATAVTEHKAPAGR